MYQIGEYVVCRNKGVCRLDQITTLDLPGVSKERKYYILKPVYAAGSTVYIPIDTDDSSLRLALSDKEANCLISSIPEIPIIPLADEKTLETTYKEAIRQNTCEALIQLLKTLYLRKQKRIMRGAKITSLDSRYYKMAEDFLYGELSVSLSKSKEEIKSLITATIIDTFSDCITV